MFSLARLFTALAQASDDPPRLRISDSFPDVELTNQFGEQLSFRRDLVDRGQALVVNSMYTTCRGSCPGTSAAIQRLRADLNPVFGRRLSFVSFTLEPEVDRPEVLRKYSKRYGAGSRAPDVCDWHFVTAEPPMIERLRRPLGFFDLDPRVDQDVTQHASLLLVGNCTTDRWCMLPSELHHTTLVETIRRIAGFTFEQKYGLPS